MWFFRMEPLRCFDFSIRASSTVSLKPWPDTFTMRLVSLGLRNCGSAELWGEVKDWLEQHDIDPVELPVDQLPEHKGKFV